MFIQIVRAARLRNDQRRNHHHRSKTIRIGLGWMNGEKSGPERGSFRSKKYPSVTEASTPEAHRNAQRDVTAEHSLPTGWNENRDDSGKIRVVWMDTVSNGVTWLLTMNTLVVLGFAGWFLVGVMLYARNKVALDTWYSLWQPLIQPSIGLLMMGALGSGLVGWLRRRGQQP